VFFTREGPAYVYAVNIDSKQVTRLASIPPRGIISSVNADETLLVGTFVEGTAPEFNQFMGKAAQEALAAALKDPTAKRLTKDDIKLRAMKMRLEAKIPEDMFTVNLETGKVNIILKGTDWLNRVQFSPTDPNLIMYAHEGHSTDVDRIWTIRADGSQNQMIHMRGIKEESAAREFWSRDGKTIWYELQKPKGEDFALMGYDVATGNRKLFHMDKMESSMYYNSATDGSFFCGSGRRSESAHGDDPSEGQTLRSREWIEVLHPILNDADSGADPQYANWFHYNNTSSSGAPNAKYTGWFRRERLVNMYKNDYTKFEPNVRVSPDNRLVIFTSNMFGPTYVFGVEVN
jgi:oligogalacturonide lyase